MPQSIEFRVMEVMLFNTCNYNCGFCGFATSGAVKNVEDMAPFKEPAYIDRILGFFDRHSDATNKWRLTFSGGEPLLTPNLDLLSGGLIRAGHKIRYNTNLSLPIERNAAFLKANPPDGVDVFMVSLHPEGFEEYQTIHERVRILKSMGYRLIVRVVGHPQMIDTFDRVRADYSGIGVTFSALPMFSPNYPQAYTDAERTALQANFMGKSAHIQLAGGVDTRGTTCWAGTKLASLGLGLSGQGNVYRCVSCSPSGYLGNIFKDEYISFLDRPHACCQKDQLCTCGTHFEEDIIVGVEDSDCYREMKAGTARIVTSAEFQAWAARTGVTLRSQTPKKSPMGTGFGERFLVHAPELVLRSALGRRSEVAFEVGPSSDLRAYKDDVVVRRREAGISVSAPRPFGGGFQLSPPLGPNGQFVVGVKLSSQSKAAQVTLAVYRGEAAVFWNTLRGRSAEQFSEAFANGSENITVYVYNDASTEFDVESLKIYRSASAVSTPVST